MLSVPLLISPLASDGCLQVEEHLNQEEECFLHWCPKIEGIGDTSNTKHLALEQNKTRKLASVCKERKKGHFLRQKCLDSSPLGSRYQEDEASQTSLKRWAGMGSCTRMGTTAALTSSTNPSFIPPFPRGVKDRAETGGSKQTDAATHKQRKCFLKAASRQT